MQTAAGGPGHQSQVQQGPGQPPPWLPCPWQWQACWQQAGRQQAGAAAAAQREPARHQRCLHWVAGVLCHASAWPHQQLPKGVQDWFITGRLNLADHQSACAAGKQQERKVKRKKLRLLAAKQECFTGHRRRLSACPICAEGRQSGRQAMPSNAHALLSARPTGAQLGLL